MHLLACVARYSWTLWLTWNFNLIFTTHDTWSSISQRSCQSIDDNESHWCYSSLISYIGKILALWAINGLRSRYVRAEYNIWAYQSHLLWCSLKLWMVFEITNNMELTTWVSNYKKGIVCFKAENKFKPKMFKASILMHFKFEYVCVCACV